MADQQRGRRPSHKSPSPAPQLSQAPSVSQSANTSNQQYQPRFNDVPDFFQQSSLNSFAFPAGDFPQQQEQQPIQHQTSTSDQFIDFSQPQQHFPLNQSNTLPSSFNNFDQLSSFDPTANYESSLDNPFQTDENFANFEPFDDSEFLNVDFRTSTASHDPLGLSNTGLGNMSTLHQSSPDAPHLLHPDMPSQPIASNSAHTSPNMFQNGFTDAYNHNSSLDPASAAYSQGADWTTYRHRRTPSDRSDVSSVNNTPFLGGNLDSFEPSPGVPSPMLNGAQDNSVFGPDALGHFNQFSLNENGGSSYHTPSHSSHPSPYLAPQHQQQMFDTQDQFDMSSNAHFNNMQSQGVHNMSEPFPSMSHTESGQELGMADQMSPPAITFEPAPPSKQPSWNLAEMQFGEVSGLGLPPNRQRRANSDPHSVGSDHTSPQRQRSPSLGLHPSDSLTTGPVGGVQKHHSRRSSSPALPGSRGQSRERTVEMAMQAVSRGTSPQPNGGSSAAGSPGSNSGFEDGSPDPNVGGRRSTQKHPATYECTLCPKRFTRAYNLRSHLRTHTDERPFVCTVCGKAFARQHDRKRHEGLHTGERRFVCKGTLTENALMTADNQWGCGRRFARADALGRHFRSEAGRACIKPLLDEEHRQRQQHQVEERYQHQLLNQSSAANLVDPGMENMALQSGQNVVEDIDYSTLPLPAVLLAQFPALRDIQWNAPPGHAAQGQGGDYDNSDYDEGHSGRSSFDQGRSSFEASDGGEWDEGQDELNFGQRFQQGQQQLQNNNGEGDAWYW